MTVRGVCASRVRMTKHLLVVTFLAASASLGGPMVLGPAEAQGRVGDPVAGSADPAVHAKGTSHASPRTEGTRAWTPQVRPVNALACTTEAGQQRHGPTDAGCGCGPAQTPRVERVAGTNRYATAAAMVPRYRNEVSTVYIVNGAAFSDAASAASAAGAGVVPGGSRAWAPAPLLLTGRDSLPATTKAALRGLSLERIVIVGGPGVVSEDVRTELGRYADPVLRVGGPDRYAASAALAERFPGNTDTVYVASGEDTSLADALTGGALAGQEGAPVLLTRPDRVDPATSDALKTLDPARTVVLGGPGAVSPAVYTALRADERVHGSDRYGTAAAVARRFSPEQSGAFLASGEAFPDALTGAALAGSLRQPLLLSQSAEIPDPVVQELERLSPARFTLLGGTGPLGAAVEDQANRHYPEWVR